MELLPPSNAARVARRRDVGRELTAYRGPGPLLSGSAVSSTMVERLNQRDFIMPWGPASVVQCDIMGITSINYRRCSAVFNFLS